MPKIFIFLAALIVMVMSIIYGGNPKVYFPQVFGVSLDSIVLQNQFRAIMGLYFAFSAYWFYCLLAKRNLNNCVLTIILFMGGLALGRLLSFSIDGYSSHYFMGMLLEFAFIIWGMLILINPSWREFISQKRPK